MVEQGEKYVHHILTKRVEDLCAAYEPNVFEHCASRWLRLVCPAVVESLCSVSLSSLTKSVYDLTDPHKSQQFAAAGARRKTLKDGEVKPAPGAAVAQTAGLSLTDQADLKFPKNLDEKKILRLCKKPSGVRVTKIRDVVPDWELEKTEYAVGVLTQEGAMTMNSFCVTSSTSSEACYYLPSEPPAHVAEECAPGSGNVYALPQSILIVQKMTTQAPKKWICFRQVKAHPELWLASELKDLRYTVTKDNSMDASSNAAVILQVRGKGGAS